MLLWIPDNVREKSYRWYYLLDLFINIVFGVRGSFVILKKTHLTLFHFSKDWFIEWKHVSSPRYEIWCVTFLILALWPEILKLQEKYEFVIKCSKWFLNVLYNGPSNKCLLLAFSFVKISIRNVSEHEIFGSSVRRCFLPFWKQKTQIEKKAFSFLPISHGSLVKKQKIVIAYTSMLVTQHLVKNSCTLHILKKYIKILQNRYLFSFEFLLIPSSSVSYSLSIDHRGICFSAFYWIFFFFHKNDFNLILPSLRWRITNENETFSTQEAATVSKNL